MEDMVNRTRVEGGGYGKHELLHDLINRQVVIPGIILDVLLYNHFTYLK